MMKPLAWTLVAALAVSVLPPLAQAQRPGANPTHPAPALPDQDRRRDDSGPATSFPHVIPYVRLPPGSIQTEPVKERFAPRVSPSEVPVPPSELRFSETRIPSGLGAERAAMARGFGGAGAGILGGIGAAIASAFGALFGRRKAK
jgi:hypothetical protein